MSKRDYYEVLGAERNATPEDLKKIFRKKAGEYHPDRHPGLDEAGRKGMEEKFKEVGEAYAVLSDPAKRERYDRFGHQAAGGGGFDPGSFEMDLGDVFGGLFGDFFGGGGRRRGGEDLRADLVLSLKEAAFGKEVELDVAAERRCEDCHGSGSRAGSKPATCRQCGGAGRVRVMQGPFQMAATCPGCQGRGQVVQDPCPSCRGQGRVRRKRTVKVSVPAGVEDGMQVRLSGEGSSGRAGEADGDLYVAIRVKAHERFQRNGDDLHVEQPISFPLAAMGGETEVVLLEGETAAVKIPAGSQPGHQVRLRGKGVQHLRRDGRGDLYVSLTVDVPTKLTQRQKELLAEFEKETGGEVKSKKKGFVDRAKDLFE